MMPPIDDESVRGDVIRLIERMEALTSAVAELRAETREQREATRETELAMRDAMSEARGMADRVADLEVWQTWALRIIVGAVVTGVLALLIGR